MSGLSTGLIAAGLVALAAFLVWPLPQRLAGGRSPADPARLLRYLPLLIGPAVLWLPGSSLLLAAIVAAVGWGALRLQARARSRAAADARRARLVEAADALASEIRAGLPPGVALGHVAETWAELEPVAAAARIDADVTAAFRRLGSQPGAAPMQEIAAAWEVAQRSGSGLAVALDRAVDRGREDLEVQRVIRAELASARATARMIALLPIVVVTGAGGADAWEFLLGSTPGLLCLAAGLGLAFVGLWWIEQIVDRVSGGER